MSGETSGEVSGFTVDMLYVHLQREIDDLRVRLDERYATQTKAVDAALVAQQTAMQTAFAAADKAVDKARDADQKAVDKALEAAEKAVDRRQGTLDREFHEHLEQVRHENALAFVNSDKAVQAALQSQKEAVTKAEMASEKRFEAVNEFRAQLNDQAALFLTRTEYAANHQNLGDRVTALTDRINRTEGSKGGTDQQTQQTQQTRSFALALAVAFTGLCGLIVALVVAFGR